MSKVFIVGPGRVGKTLALRHKQAGDSVHIFARQAGSWQSWAESNRIIPAIGPASLPADVRLIFCVQDDLLKGAIKEWLPNIQVAVNALQQADANADAHSNGAVEGTADSDSNGTVEGTADAQSFGLLLAHTSGFHDLRVFSAVHESGTNIPSGPPLRKCSGQICIAALHPILNFGKPEETLPQLAKSAITALVQGSDHLARMVVNTWGGTWLSMDPKADRHQYHLALSLAANHLTELMSRAVQNLKPSLGEHAYGVAHQLAAAALQASLQADGGQLGRKQADDGDPLGRKPADFNPVGPEHVLTGPVVRGDLATLQAHLAATPRQFKALHLLEVEAILHLAQRSGRLPMEQFNAIAQWLKQAQKDLVR